MKLRKVGNSLGATFSRECLAKSGFVEGQDLEITATYGEIKIRPAETAIHTVGFTIEEAKALVAGNMRSKECESALKKVKKIIEVNID